MAKSFDARRAFQSCSFPIRVILISFLVKKSRPRLNKNNDNNESLKRILASSKSEKTVDVENNTSENVNL